MYDELIVIKCTLPKRKPFSHDHYKYIFVNVRYDHTESAIKYILAGTNFHQLQLNSKHTHGNQTWVRAVQPWYR